MSADSPILSSMVEFSDMPLVNALAIAANRDHSRFYAPGHKGGAGAAASLKALVGAPTFRADLPELPELDNLFSPSGPIDQAQRLAAQTFGAEETFFLANGSTCGIEAALLATCAPGEKVLIPRNAHQSVFAGLVLCGAQPIYLTPIHDSSWDLAFGITAQQVDHALTNYPDIRTVVIVSPSYHGVCANLAAIAQLVHQHGATLIVDEAHGAHLGFHAHLPQGAIAAGADVIIQSTHKVLSAMTQASMLHVQGERVDRDRLRQALQITQSTSPNYLLLASLDAARYQMAQAGKELMAKTLALVNGVRDRLGAISAISLLMPDTLTPWAGDFELDMTRLVIDVSALGITGFTADDFLHQQQVIAELPTLRQLAFIWTVGNSSQDGDRLETALRCLAQQSSRWEPDRPQTAFYPATTDAITLPAMTPRDAFFAPTRAVELTSALGRICVDTLCPYPPGIPVVLPGERLTKAAIAHLQYLYRSGASLTGNPDITWETVRVVS